MMKYGRSLLIAGMLLTTSGAGSTLSAQTVDSSHAESSEARRAAEKERIRAKIEEIKYARMKKAIALDDETSAKFFAIYKPAEKELQDLIHQRNEELHKLKLLMDGAKTDADVDPELQKIRDLNHRIDDRVWALDQQLKPVLSPRQRARLLVFEHEFNKRVQLELMKHKIAQGEDIAPELKEVRREVLQDRIKRHLEERKH